ncbi:hypothetical protein LGQ03_14625 [Loktanella sp. TSTF-M6]|uniref:Uncharacterized protein n=1 Tax=Loktanella gaetbuli TaxID=2881335 RepID=A0ABS8BYG5_9RHOB|nr:hypothetical protein [Loktanella gaetbuli]MCB5200481.1 hypothetical protein [Loktanella gaetbuli]
MSTRWDRLEPNTTDETLREGVEARVADPLWMLARQWQTGEFDGEDAASPVATSLTTERTPITQFHAPDGTVQDLRNSSVPLEAKVEAILPSTHSAEDIASLCNAALHAWTLSGIKSSDLLVKLQTAYPFDAEAYRTGYPLRPAAERRLRLLARNAFDPFALVADKGKSLPANYFDSDWITAVKGLCDGRGREIAETASTWQSDRLSYEATVSTKSESGQLALKTDNYGGGRLDWYSFDHDFIDTDVLTGISSTQTKEPMPSALSYVGQPVPRFWEFEDGTVHFGGISAGPGDTARMIVADFAAIGGDDMFVLSVAAPVGCFTRVTELKVFDSFNREHTIPPALVADRSGLDDPTAGFALFTVKDAVPQKDTSDWLPILPVTAGAMNGPAIETVGFRRDEEANLAWAIEEEIEGPFGLPLRRRQAWEIPDEPVLEDDSAWPYRLQTAVPPWWIPLVPERIDKTDQIQLRRARLGVWETMDPAKTGPKSRIMDPTKAVILAEHAVPKAGLQLIRHWQIARGYDGQVVLWQSWSRSFGAKERASGLKFDTIDRKW